MSITKLTSSSLTGTGPLRIIRHPKVQVRAREVFYQLKRTAQLNGLNEDLIEEILLERAPASLIDPVCLYQNCKALELASGERLSWCPESTATLTLAMANLGDAGLNKMIAQEDAGRSRALQAWAEICLQKFFDLTNNLVSQEAAKESWEVGYFKTLNPVVDQGLWELLSERLDDRRPEIETPENDSPVRTEASTATRRFWIVPWLTKKEKKRLVVSA
ncbi:MAG: hypothetical protein HY547_01460 [Elusimicrobia bacterium]|nr:hypothetical protein [Elusimicrobiota bacterium]